MKRHSFKKAVSQLFAKQSLRRSVLSGIAAFFLIWVAFFDSHSLYKRFTWSQEASKLAVENQYLEDQIKELEHQLSTELPDEVIEQLARERYGMRKQGETVYPIKETP